MLVLGRPEIVFGVFVPQGWKMELARSTAPLRKWAKAVEVAQLAEQLGFDSIWVYDHFHNVPRPADEAVFECWTTMAAISQLTSTIRLGQMVGCNSYRNPALLAKITSNIDVMSGGRLDWGIGAGWYENEYRALRLRLPRSRRTASGCSTRRCRSCARCGPRPRRRSAASTTSVKRAQCDPKPLQQPHPPIWIGGGGEQLTLRVVAKYADCSNFGGSPEVWAHKRDVLHDHCVAVGRDPDAIRMTWSPEVFIRSTEAEVVAAGSLAVWGQPVDEWRANNLVGTPEQVVEKMRSYVDLGCRGFVPWCADYPDTETLELFAEIMPETCGR